MEGCTCCRGIDFSYKTLKGHIVENVTWVFLLERNFLRNYFFELSLEGNAFIK